MLLRPTRPLPRRFNRRVSKGTAEFVQRRHHRRQRSSHERLVRTYRRSQRFLSWTVDFLRQWFLLSIFTLLLLGFAVLLFSPLVHVREIRIKRTDARLDSERIQRSLRPMFGRHLFFLPPHDVKVLVQDAMPDASNVQVDKQYPSTLSLTITLHPLIARLQIEEEGGAAPPTAPSAGTGASPAKRYEYLTDNGLFISLSSEAASATALPLIRVVDWAVRPVPSTPLLSGEFLKRLQDVETQLRDEFGLTIKGRAVFLRAREFHVQTTTYSLWLDMASPLDDQLRRYKLFLTHVQPRDVKEYVDLRLVGKIVYR